MENAILAHAAALTSLASAIEKAFAGGAPLSLGKMTEHVVVPAADAQEVPESKTTAREAIQQALDAAKAETKKGKADPKKESTAETTTSDASPDGAGSSVDDAVLDYNKEVKPRLLAVVKKVGKEKLAALVKTFGVDRADAVDPAKFAELLTAAEKLEK
jgi:hypothetical protein